MTAPPPILCIGSALWDIIARADRPMRRGADVPGQISRQLGGVALNVALALAAQGARVGLLSAVGRDPQGDRLLAEAAAVGIDCGHVMRFDGPTDTYMAIEDHRGEVFGAVADCASLELAGRRILAPLTDGPLGSAGGPWAGTVIVDGNLPVEVLDSLASDPAFAAAVLAFVPASPGKAKRLRGVLRDAGGTIYVNLGEAEILCGAKLTSAKAAAVALIEAGASRAVVTNGRRKAAVATARTIITRKPPKVDALTTTGAGDVFLAAHLAAEAGGASEEEAIDAAIAASAAHITRAAAE